MEEKIKEKVETYLNKAESLFNIEELDASPELIRKKKRFRTMAEAYYNDAKHFYANGEYINALAALEYAEGWLDAGVEMGFFRQKRKM